MAPELVQILAISIIGGIISAAVAVSIVCFRYKRKLQSAIYPLEHFASLHLSHSDDTFIGKSVTRTRVASSNSNRNRK